MKRSLPQNPSGFVTLLLVAAIAGDAGADDLVVTQNGTVTELSLGNAQPFHTTQHDVTNARQIAVPNSTGSVILWEELDGGGPSTHFYAISLDGAIVDSETVQQTDYELKLRTAHFDPLGAEPPVPGDLVADGSNELYVVQFVSPPLFQFVQAVEALGARMHHFVHNHAYVTQIPGQAFAVIDDLAFVRSVVPYHPAYRLEESLAAEVAEGLSSSAERKYSIMVVEGSPAGQQPVIDRIAALGGETYGACPECIRLEAMLTLDELAEVVHMNEVLFIDEPGEIEEAMDIAREVSGANYVESVGSYRGQGVRGEVMEYTLRTSHVAFQHPLPYPAYPLVHGQALPSWTDPDDPRHGTNTYGIIFGDGTINVTGAKDLSKRGVLPEGEGIIATRQPFWPDPPPLEPCQAFPTLTNRYCHISQLVKQDHCPASPPDPNCPYEAVFHNASWGHFPATEYGTIAAEMDHIIFDLDILICTATGNQLACVPQTPKHQEPWAKNIITVGGAHHFDTVNQADDRWCSTIGGFNSTATTGLALPDGRIKPDHLLHFYDRIGTTDSDSDIDYVPDFDGTRAATPITCGHFGLLFQMYADDSDGDGKNIFGMPVPSCNPGTENCVFKRRPHAATAKAMMINTAVQYDWTNPPAPGANADIDRFKQGWGMANVRNLYDLRNKMMIVDESKLIVPLGAAQFTVKVSAGEPALRVTMVYADPPGNPAVQTMHRVNDLSLRVRSPSGTSTYFGNDGLATALWSAPDPTPLPPNENNDTFNTVENVFIQNPPAGLWTIRVKAHEINQDGHAETPATDADFALVVTGAVGIGACHLAGEVCIETDRADCVAQGGTYDGDNTLCCEPTCE
jgi:hypothetical protein